MGTFGKLHIGLGLTLATAISLVAGATLAGNMNLQKGDRSERCTMSGGEKWARLVVDKVDRTAQIVVCYREPFISAVPPGPDDQSCYSIKDAFGCDIITR
ncbi:hypothetical protein WME73_22345 [Sorangium sp. So ce302]|uniref:hypothetical protein n=1 Tax=Sorangium sp. So ce302 TaxID=3133297 RepID=UPI003F6160F6